MQNCHTILQAALVLSFIDSIHDWVIWVAPSPIFFHKLVSLHFIESPIHQEVREVLMLLSIELVAE